MGIGMEMERRLHQRYQVQYEARVTKRGQRESSRGRVLDISQTGMSVDLPVQLAPGDAVQLEMADSVVTARVAHSTPDGAGYRTGIEVIRVTLGATDLSYLLQRTLLEVMPTTLGLETVDSQCG
jgi:hypothetical protein